MNKKNNAIFFEDLPEELQKEIADACNHYCDTIRKTTIDGKEWLVIDELTQLNESGKKLVKIYDILYDLYVDDTDCTQCAYFNDCTFLGHDCLYHEDFMGREDIKEFLTKKAQEIYEIATK